MSSWISGTLYVAGAVATAVTLYRERWVVAGLGLLLLSLVIRALGWQFMTLGLLYVVVAPMARITKLLLDWTGVAPEMSVALVGLMLLASVFYFIVWGLLKRVLKWIRVWVPVEERLSEFFEWVEDFSDALLERAKSCLRLGERRAAAE